MDSIRVTEIWPKMFSWTKEYSLSACSIRRLLCRCSLTLSPLWNSPTPSTPSSVGTRAVQTSWGVTRTHTCRTFLDRPVQSSHHETRQHSTPIVKSAHLQPIRRPWSNDRLRIRRRSRHWLRTTASFPHSLRILQGSYLRRESSYHLETVLNRSTIYK